jgi:hypothetical protein
MDLRPDCYTIDVRGCSPEVFRVVKAEDKAVFSDLLVLLASCHFLSEHSHQGTSHLSMVLAQKLVWTRGPKCCSWVQLTTPAPDSPKAEVVADEIVFGSEGDIEVADDDVFGNTGAIGK